MGVNQLSGSLSNQINVDIYRGFMVLFLWKIHQKTDYWSFASRVIETQAVIEA